jgi:hypothetical protein
MMKVKGQNLKDIRLRLTTENANRPKREETFQFNFFI